MSDNNGTAPAKPSAAQLLKEVRSEGKAKKSKGKKPNAKAVKPIPPKKTEAEGVKPVLDFLKLPKAKLETVARKDIMQDRRLQHRKDLKDLSDGGAVAQYAELMKDGVEFPPVSCVRDISDTKDKGTLWLYDGYQRVGAHEVNKISEIESHIVEGTFADAMLLSLAANGENSVIPRTREDIRRSIFALLDNPPVLERVLKASKGNGGAHRVIAKACGCSAGAVVLALEARGKRLKGDEILDATKPKKKPEAAKPEPKPDGALVVREYSAPAPATPARQKNLDKDAFVRMSALQTDTLVSELRTSVRRIGSIFAAFVTNPDYGDEVKIHLEESGFGLPAEWEEKSKEKDFFPVYEMLELWSLIPTLAELVDGAARVIAERTAKQLAEANEKTAQQSAAAGK